MLDIKKAIEDLSKMGFRCEESTTESAELSATAAFQTARGPLEIFAVEAGARFGKPNGTVKFYYKISNAQLMAVARQTIKANS